MKLFSCLGISLLIAGSTALAIDSHNHHSVAHPVAVRREWGSLSKPERRAYIDAVLCMQNLPSIIPEGEVPGALSRFDDFLAVHANYSMTIHLDGIFLSWHRQFVWLWETALRDECGYDSYQPYWNWALWADDLAGSPLFDGSDTSLSGDGEYVDYGGYVIGGADLPHGTGGGCVTSGPFQNMSINLGPFAVELVFSGGLPSNWTTYTPHCLERDLNNYIATRYNNQSAVDDLVAQPDITSFQAAMDTLSPNSANIGSHTGGHFSLGLALIDFFVSPGDPAFFLHHAMIDRVWATWQAIDPETRLYALNGTTVIFDPPGAPEATLDTIQSWGALGEEKRTGDLMNIDDGDYCYGYE